MNKKWTIILLAVIFISANVVTFLFTQGKIKIVEKVVTVYKEADAKSDVSPIVAGNAKVESALAKQTSSKKAATINFNDSDYLTDAKELKEAQTAQDGKQETAKDSGKSAKPEEAASAAGHETGIDNSTHNAESPKTVKLADESIPIPQLPLFDTDFDSGTDVGGTSNVPLPQLPDISEVVSDDYYES